MPPVLATERVEVAAELLDFVMSGLSDTERNRFEYEFSEATRHPEGRDALVHLLQSWTLTVVMRSDSTYEEQYEGFMGAVRSNPSE